MSVFGLEIILSKLQETSSLSSLLSQIRADLEQYGKFSSLINYNTQYTHVHATA